MITRTMHMNMSRVNNAMRRLKISSGCALELAAIVTGVDELEGFTIVSLALVRLRIELELLLKKDDQITMDRSKMARQNRKRIEANKGKGGEKKRR